MRIYLFLSGIFCLGILICGCTSIKPSSNNGIVPIITRDPIIGIWKGEDCSFGEAKLVFADDGTFYLHFGSAGMTGTWKKIVDGSYEATYTTSVAGVGPMGGVLSIDYDKSSNTITTSLSSLCGNSKFLKSQ